MAADMSEDIIGAMSFGRAAMRKVGNVPENFRFYEAGWIDDKKSKSRIMEVKGAEFRVAKSGPNKGELCVKVEDSERKVFVTEEEIKSEIQN